MGTYSGYADSQPTTINVALDGNHLVMTASPDVLGAQCSSRIGDLKRVRVGGNNNNYYVEGASFAFDPNYCVMVQGRELDVSLRRQNGQIRLSTSVLESTEWRQECTPECTPMNGCQNHCQMVPYQKYARGNFVKVN